MQNRKVVLNACSAYRLPPLMRWIWRDNKREIIWKKWVYVNLTHWELAILTVEWNTFLDFGRSALFRSVSCLLAILSCFSGIIQQWIRGKSLWIVWMRFYSGSTRSVYWFVTIWRNVRQWGKIQISVSLQFWKCLSMRQGHCFLEMCWPLHSRCLKLRRLIYL